MLITRVLHVMSCCCYHKGTYFQANHNLYLFLRNLLQVVVATTKVRIFKQITTIIYNFSLNRGLLLLPQRYVFSSKSQLINVPHSCISSCCCYHKGTYFQANHNTRNCKRYKLFVVVATTKVRIFKQITTDGCTTWHGEKLLLLPQRYVFSSKSQHSYVAWCPELCCCCYHKGTYFQANHNHVGVR